MGDQVLRSLGEVVKACIRRDVDSAYRYGGDEFVVLLPDTDREQARFAALRIQKQFSTFRFGRVGISIGITEAQPDEDENTLLRRADDAMYESKNSGRGSITTR